MHKLLDEMVKRETLKVNKIKVIINDDKDHLKQENLTNKATQIGFLGEITTYPNSTKSKEGS